MQRGHSVLPVFIGSTWIISSPFSTFRVQSSLSYSVKPNCLTMLKGTVVLRDSLFVADLALPQGYLKPERVDLTWHSEFILAFFFGGSAGFMHGVEGRFLVFRNADARFWKAFALVFFVFLFFLFMSRIDFTVNSVLYNYGLVFSYNWANTYWLTYSFTFVVFSATAAFVYWLASPKTSFDKRVAVALLVTINLLALGGLQDILYFTVWAGGLPVNSVVWWWSQWAGVFGTWNSLLQLEFMLVMVGVSALTWSLALRQNETFKYNSDGLSGKVLKSCDNR